MSETAKNNYKIGRLMYMATTDAAGYPNGMAYWPEMSDSEKYYYCCLGIDLLEKVHDSLDGIVVQDESVFGLRKSRWGEGECKALMDYIESVREEELDDFNGRVSALQAAFKEHREEHPEEDSSD